MYSPCTASQRSEIFSVLLSWNMQRDVRGTFYGLMVYCKLQCQNLSVHTLVWYMIWGKHLEWKYLHLCLCGLALTVLLCSGLSRSFYFAPFGKRKINFLVLTLIWFYILDDFMLYNVGIFCLILFFFFCFIFWRWFYYLKNIPRHLSGRDFNSVNMLRLTQSLHRTRPQTLSPCDCLKSLHKVSYRIIASGWKKPLIIFPKICYL